MQIDAGEEDFVYCPIHKGLIHCLQYRCKQWKKQNEECGLLRNIVWRYLIHLNEEEISLEQETEDAATKWTSGY